MTAPVTYIPEFVDDHEIIFSTLWNELAWEKREFAPRREYWTNIFNRSYTYGSGAGQRTYEPNVTHPSIESVSDRLEALLNFRYAACFLNGYETARDHLGFHADDDPGINHERPIAVVTVGSGRLIKFLEKETGEKGEIFLEPGSLFLMHAGMQDTHLHSIPKAGFVVKIPRISLTFRSLKENIDGLS